MKRLLFALAALCLATPALACGPTEACGDTASSLHGQVLTEGILLEWSTNDDNSAVGFYRLLRNNCPTDPTSCETQVAVIQRAGTCGTQHDYSYTDTPATPLSQWNYTVELWTSGNARTCAIDVDPQ